MLLNSSSLLSEWLTYIESLHAKTVALGLERVRPVAEKLSLCHFDCPVVTIAGTNGKGSCVAFLEAILQAAGYRVGAYTSPHLLRFNERVRVNGEVVADAALVEAFAQIEQARGQIELTFFEFTTLAALLIFRRARLDALLLEVGLGGRLDAVNMVESDIAIITTVALDHMDWLGNDRESIGREKAGIFRHKKPAICGDFTPPASVLEAAQRLESPLYCLEKDFSVVEFPLSRLRSMRSEEGCRGALPSPTPSLASVEGEILMEAPHFSWQSRNTCLTGLPIPQLPLQNAATALMAVQLLQPRLPMETVAIKQGLAEARAPGRFQQFSTPVNVILDVAHNPAAAELLAKRLCQHTIEGRTYAVVSILADKDIFATLQPLLPCIDHWFLAGLDLPRGATTEIMVNHLQELGVSAYHTASSVLAAFMQAIQHCGLQDRIVVFGSFHTVAPVLDYLHKSLAPRKRLEKPQWTSD